MVMKLNELKSLTAPELEAKGRDFRQELFNLRLRQTAGQLEKPSRLRDLRKSLARIQTLINQKRKAV
jgi:large subunit ribosomal protein L29